MEKRGSGKILNVSSLAAFQPGPLMSLYYASKAYILSFSEAIANELKGSGVSVTVLCPGQTNTGFQKVVASTASENKIKFNIACPRAVAKYGYKAMLQGKTIAIPGPFNRFLSNVPRFIPRRLVTSIVRRLQESNRKSS
jgi:short-subunit dehydrogenase